MACCGYCGKTIDKPANQINRANKNGSPLYCNRKCYGLNRRSDDRTLEQKKLDKRSYDMEYRAKNKTLLQEKKAKWFQETYDPIKAAEIRKLRMPGHVEYCRQPKYKAYKQQYDAKYRAKTNFGEFWESSILLVNLEKEISSRMDWNEIRALNGILNKKQTRRRNYERLNSY